MPVSKFKSISKMAGRVGRPGIVLIYESGQKILLAFLKFIFLKGGRKKRIITVPTRGYRNPAPTLALTSRIGTINPVGAPFNEGSCDNDRCVLAMQTGRLLKPYTTEICISLTYSSLFFFCFFE